MIITRRMTRAMTQTRIMTQTERRDLEEKPLSRGRRAVRDRSSQNHPLFSIIVKYITRTYWTYYDSRFSLKVHFIHLDDIKLPS